MNNVRTVYSDRRNGCQGIFSVVLWKKQVYSVGTSYFHGEARKSPTVDGKVERDETGKEACF